MLGLAVGIDYALFIVTRYRQELRSRRGRRHRDQHRRGHRRLRRGHRGPHRRHRAGRPVRRRHPVPDPDGRRGGADHRRRRPRRAHAGARPCWATSATGRCPGSSGPPPTGTGSGAPARRARLPGRLDHHGHPPPRRRAAPGRRGAGDDLDPVLLDADHPGADPAGREHPGPRRAAARRRLRPRASTARSPSSSRGTAPPTAAGRVSGAAHGAGRRRARHPADPERRRHRGPADRHPGVRPDRPGDRAARRRPAGRAGRPRRHRRLGHRRDGRQRRRRAEPRRRPCRSTWRWSSGWRWSCWCWCSARCSCRWSASSGFLLTVGASLGRDGRRLPVGLAGRRGQPRHHRPADQPHADPGDRDPVRAGDGLPDLPGVPDARGAQPRRGAAGGDPHRLPAGGPGRRRRRADHVLGVRRVRRRPATPTIKSIAFALAAGILFDAFVVRMVLVPAALALLGERAWWLPRWLRWLPVLDVEGAGLEKAAHTRIEDMEPVGAGAR